MLHNAPLQQNDDGEDGVDDNGIVGDGDVSDGAAAADNLSFKTR